MTFEGLFGKINRSVPKVEKKEVLSVGNEVIGNINGKYPGQFIVETALTRKTADETLELWLDYVAGTITAGVTVNFVTLGFAVGQTIYIVDTLLEKYSNTPIIITAISDDGGTNNVIESSSVFSTVHTSVSEITGYELDSNYLWDHTNKILTIPSYVKETLDVLVDTPETSGLAYDNKPISSVEGSANTQEARYTMLSKYIIQLTTLSLATVDQKLRIEMIKRIPNMTSVDPTTEIDIPVDLESTLLAGCFFYLLTRPPHDEDKYDKMAAANKEVFIAGLFDARDVEDDSRPPSDISPVFVYQNPRDDD